MTDPLQSSGAESVSNATAALPQAALEQLGRQVAALKSVSLEFTESMGGLGSGDHAGPTRYSAQFEGNRFYCHWQRNWRQPEKLLQTQKPLSPEHEASFDGKVLYIGTPKQVPTYTHAILNKFLPADAAAPDSRQTVVHFPYLNAAGFFVPERPSEASGFASIEPLVLRCLKESRSTTVKEENGGLRVTIRMDDPYLLEVGRIDLAKYKSADDKQEREIFAHLQELTPTRTVSFLLDPQRGYATVEREEWTAAGQKIVRITPDQWKHYETAGIWLPGRCVAEYFMVPTELKEFSKTPVMAITHDLQRIEFESKRGASDTFALDYSEPGTMVTDRTTPEAQARPDRRVMYKIPGGKDELRLATEAQSRRKPGFMILLIVLAFAVAGIFALMWNRKNQ